MILIPYFQRIKSSLTSLEYYFEIIEKPIKTSTIFFIFTILILGLINGANFAIIKLPEIKNDANLALNDLNENFDKNLEIIWADNQLEFNQEYVNIYWPSTLDYKPYNLPNLFGIISNSQKPPYESELVANGNSLVYINKNYLYSLQNTTVDHESNNQTTKEDWVEYPLATIFDGVSSYSINKQNLPKITLSISDAINKIFLEVQVFVTFVTSILYLFSKIWFLFIESILVFLLFKIYNFGFDFNKVLKLNLNIMVPTAIIETITNLIYRDLTLPMGTIAFWTILTYISFNLKKIKSKKQIS